MNTDEIWKDIPNYEGWYQASTLGRIRGVERWVKNGVGYRVVRKKMLKQALRPDGYMGITLKKNGASKTHTVHRLVLSTFLLNEHGKDSINHKNGIKTDNRLENLEWCTRSENMKHAYKNGLSTPMHGEKGNNSKLSNKDALKIRMLKNSGSSVVEIAKMYNVHNSTISRICNRLRFKNI